MRIEIPKVTRPIRLSEFLEEFGEAQIQVWVNPPRTLMQKYWTDRREAVRIVQLVNSENATKEDALRLVEIGDELIEWFATIWSQGPEETRWTVEDARQLAAHSKDEEPELWKWLSDRTLELIGEHRTRQKKVSMPL